MPFAVGASVPILPYLLFTTTTGLIVSVVLTLGTLFVMGVMQARLVGTALPHALGISPPAN